MIELTAADVRGKRGDLRLKLFGYDRDEVDAYFGVLAECLASITLENARVSKKAAALAQRFEVLESRANAVQEALISGQRLRFQIIQQAKHDTEALLARGRSEAGALIREAAEERRRHLEAREHQVVRAREEAVGEIESARRLTATQVARLRADLEHLARYEKKLIGRLQARRTGILSSLRSLIERELADVARQEAPPDPSSDQIPPGHDSRPRASDTVQEEAATGMDSESDTTRDGPLPPQVVKDRHPDQGDPSKESDEPIEEVVVVSLDYLIGFEDAIGADPTLRERRLQDQHQPTRDTPGRPPTHPPQSQDP